MRRLVLGAAAAAALVPAPSAEAEVFVAYGEGLTHCRIETNREHWKGITTGGDEAQSYFGETDCSVALEQTGQAIVDDLGPSEPERDGGVCSGVVTSCFSGELEYWSMSTSPMIYRVYLRAPRGQGWLGAPTNCSGVGTDNLKCEFVVGLSWRATGPLLGGPTR